MRIEVLKKLIKGANQFSRIKLYAKKSTGGKINLWVYKNYERKSLKLLPIQINNKIMQEEYALVKKAIDIRNSMEAIEGDSVMSMAKKLPVSIVLEEWINHYTFIHSKNGAKLAKTKFLKANDDIPVGSVNRKSIIKMMDMMRKQNVHTNYVRNIASRIRAFCNWAEQRGYMNAVDTRKLLPPEQFGEVRALNEKELRQLAATPCKKFPDIKDLFMLGVYTAQRLGEMKNYTFAMLYNKEIRTRQGKTGKFIKIPLSKNALNIMRELKARRESEGLNTGEKDKMFRLPANMHIYRHFKKWLEAAGLDRNRITPYNSRSTAISLLINKGVPEAVTQELANHADPRVTARYYRQIDDSKKRAAVNLIPSF
ncbi:MAG: tyrosine-type recombinase/integrase [Fibromonadales bacterium]|nr:tyrosine-type recombinase/integrase [Fibromonadales bacterium]